MSPTPFRSTLHRDGTATVWDVYAQGWTRIFRMWISLSASMDATERARVERHLARI